MSARLKRYQDPDAALPPSERLPLRERIACGLTLAAAIGMLIWIALQWWQT